MTDALNKLTIVSKTGREKFHTNGQTLDFDLSSFWAWSVSDLVSNATRGRLAEYIVAWCFGTCNIGHP